MPEFPPPTVMRGTDGVDTAAMRGTDSAFLASSLAYYGYSAALANVATYVPAQKTIVMTAFLTGQNAAGELELLVGADILQEATNSALDYPFHGYIGSIMCDGTNVGFKNDTGAEETISLYGVTIA